MKKQAKPHKKDEISERMRIKAIYDSFTLQENTQDKLLEVLSFLIAQRDGHGHKFKIGQVVKKTKDVLESIGVVFGEKTTKETSSIFAKAKVCQCPDMSMKGEELKRLRGEAGLTRMQLTAKMADCGWCFTKIKRLEKISRFCISGPEMESLLIALNVTKK